MDVSLLLILLIGGLVWLIFRTELLARRTSNNAGSVPSEAIERLERELRDAISDGRKEMFESARVQREELSTSMSRFAGDLREQMTTIAAAQNSRIDSLTDSNNKHLAEIRVTLEAKLKTLQEDNTAKLEQMRHTVDEKLHATLEQRLTESFKVVSDRLELVHRGLGEMQTLASGVGDLKKLLTNVKTRGGWGEFQLGSILEQILAPTQFEKNVATKKGSNDRVEYAIRLPGRGKDEEVVWLPIDAKFPREDYERLIDAHERGDIQAADEAGKQLENRIKLEAKRIRDKYVDPPNTTDVALMFLPTEGLYAEVARRPKLSDALQEYKVMVAGPTNLSALLNSLQMGFRTLAIEKRSSEVWEILGAVKGEFHRFGEALAKTKKKLEEATDTIGSAEVRTRAIARKLRGVEELPAQVTSSILEVEEIDLEDVETQVADAKKEES